MARLALGTDAAVSVNGVDLSTCGRAFALPNGTPAPFALHVADPGALFDGLDLSAGGGGDTFGGAAGRLGATADGVPAAAAARDWTLTLALRAASGASLAAARDAVVALFPPNAPLLVRTAFDPAREYVARRVKLGGTVGAPGFLQRDATLTVGLRLLTPAARSRSALVVGFGALPTPTPLGTLPVEPLVRVAAAAGTVTNPTLTVRDLLGRVVASVTLVGALAGAEYVEIDCRRKTVTTSLAANGYVRADGYAWLNGAGGAGDFFALDPRDGDPRAPGAGAWPTLEVSSTGGTPRGVATYRAAWE